MISFLQTDGSTILIVIAFFAFIIGLFGLLFKFAGVKPQSRIRYKYACKSLSRNQFESPQLQQAIANPQTVMFGFTSILFLIVYIRVRSRFMLVEPIDSQTIHIYIINKNHAFTNFEPHVVSINQLSYRDGKVYIEGIKDGFKVVSPDKTTTAAEQFLNQYFSV